MVFWFTMKWTFGSFGRNNYDKRAESPFPFLGKTLRRQGRLAAERAG
jgi:hypothetical protein